METSQSPFGIRLRADLRAASDRYLSALSDGQIAEVALEELQVSRYISQRFPQVVAGDIRECSTSLAPTAGLRELPGVAPLNLDIG